MWKSLSPTAWRPAALGFCVVALAVLAGAAQSPAQSPAQDSTFKGRAPRVVDSGLLDFAGQPVYLYGLRGVPADQNCPLGSRVWACGLEANWAARNRIANHWVDCVERARGAKGEVFAVCYLGGVGGPELNHWLVEEGWALAAGDYAPDYVEAEAAARAAGRGLWRGQ